MPLHIEESDSSWKTQLRERIMKSLEVMLQGAHIAYQNKLAEVPPTAHEARYRLQIEYTQDQKNLRRYADEELRFEIQREEQERLWCLQSVQHQQPEVDEGNDDAVAEWKKNVLHDQVMILNAIKNQTGHMDEQPGGLFQQGSSTKPFPSYSSSSSKLPYHHSSFDRPSERHIPHIPTNQTELVAADLEARLHIERQAKQQEEFRKRAEAIQLRKRRERGWDSYPESLSSSSSTSSSDQESSTTTDNTSAYSSPSSDPVSRLSEEEFVNLVIFHDQQWDWITTLPHLQWTDFPWPVLSFSGPTRKEDLTLEAVADYVFAPLRLHHDRTMSKERLKEIIRRWHPDRFEVKYLARVGDLHEREMVREGAGMVARFLNDLLGKWNDV
ncbi:hypothetical protein BYT27DRAFT_7155016 [Phlegmacium glaucopus]|nr:hypothetical protein BYT27DRAFT_7155016 [Phlegmacium glaucopus]